MTRTDGAQGSWLLSCGEAGNNPSPRPPLGHAGKRDTPMQVRHGS